MQEFSVVEQNLRRLLQQADAAINDPGKENVEFGNLPTNPFDKKLFNKRGRSSRYNLARSESEERMPCTVQVQQPSSGKKQRSDSHHKSQSKQKRVLAEYLQDDLIERRVEDNNRLFKDILEYVAGLRDKVNVQIRQKYTESSKRERTATAITEQPSSHRNSELLLSNIKSFFEQLFANNPQHFPKRIQTIIEFQSVENTINSPLVYRRTLPQEPHIEHSESEPSGVSYFRKSMVGLGKFVESSQKNSRVNQKSLQNTLKNSRQTITTEAQKKSSVYETVLNQRKAKLKKNK